MRAFATSARRIAQRRLASSVSPEEVEKFAAQASRWWDESGPASMLHRMNPVRVAFIRSALEGIRTGHDSRTPLSGLKVLDVGCGVGILAEPLARLGARVHGCDPSAASITAALQHCGESLPNLIYSNATVEHLVTKKERYDCVIASEVIEHVEEPSEFLGRCTSLVNDSGILVLSSINRTVSSFALTKVLAEYVLGLLPVGTHSWERYPRPEEIAGQLSQHNFQVDEVAGMVFNPISRDFKLSTDSSVNFILSASKRRDDTWAHRTKPPA